MAAVIDLTGASTPQTPTRKASQLLNNVYNSSSSLQASRSFCHSLFQQHQHIVTNDDQFIDPSMDNDGHIYLVPVSPTTTRKSTDTATSHRSLVMSSPFQSRSSQASYTHSEDKKQRLNKTPTRSRGQSIAQSKPSSRSLAAPFDELAISMTPPEAKRRCIGPRRPSIIGRKMNIRANPPLEVDENDTETESNSIDLTISDNFPVWKSSEERLKGGMYDLSERPDCTESNSKAVKHASRPSSPTEPANNTHDGKASKRLTAPGVRRRLAALGIATKIDPLSIIDLSTDSDSGEEGDNEREATQEQFRRPRIIGPEDYLDDYEIGKLLANLEIGPARTLPTTSKSVPSREHIADFSHGSSRYKAGKSAELRNGNFLRIVSVLKDEDGNVFLSGHLLSRQSSWARAMPKRKNELVWVLGLSKAEFENGLDPKPTEVRLIEAVGIRSVTFTNQPYPQTSLKTYKDGGFKNTRDELSTGPLFCRWKSIKVIGERNQKYEDSLAHLSYAEADPKPKARIRPSLVRDMWRRSETVLGGSYFATRKSIVNLASPCSDSPSESIQQYTFGDAFCGAGGCSTGASQAGLHLCWGFDKDKDAISVYAVNLGRREGVECLNEAVDEFHGRCDICRFIVDILHLSPPCQPFSAAHTIPSEIQDEINQAALLSVWHVLEKIKPRIVTIEETEGLVNRHVEWFNALINIFISLNYSVRWKVVKCQEYGVPQQRKRLYIIAAGPGETLPHFARPTHGEPGSGLQPFKKIRHYIKDIPRNATQHETADRFPRGPRTPFSDDQFAKTLTCSGGVGNYHPSGLRFYTIREAASLQTFPISYAFTTDSKTKARRQIGNAVPPLLARSMYREIIKCLKESDRLEALSEASQI